MKITVRRQNRHNMMMRAVPGGVEVFIPRWLKEDNPQVKRFITDGLKKIEPHVPPLPVQQTSPEAIRAMVDAWSARLGVQPKRVSLREMARKWGSCSSVGNITLNSRLCWLPAPLAEYVVLHEVVHMRVFNHGKDFKAMMSQYMPDWPEREQTLNSYTFR